MWSNSETAAIYTYITLVELEDTGVILDEVMCDVVSEWRWHIDFGFVPKRLWNDLHGSAPLDFDAAVRIAVGLYILGITMGVRYEGSTAYMEGLLLHAPHEWMGRFEPEVFRIVQEKEGTRRTAQISEPYGQ